MWLTLYGNYASALSRVTFEYPSEPFRVNIHGQPRMVLQIANKALSISGKLWLEIASCMRPN
jgi:hypothetical protein